MRHSFEAHSSSANFTFTCGVDGCPRSFATLSGMMSHLNRKHRGVDLDQVQSLESSCTNEEQQHEVNHEGIMADIPESGLHISEPSFD